MLLTKQNWTLSDPIKITQLTLGRSRERIRILPCARAFCAFKLLSLPFVLACSEKENPFLKQTRHFIVKG
jgi:hypothetical protein